MARTCVGNTATGSFQATTVATAISTQCSVSVLDALELCRVGSWIPVRMGFLVCGAWVKKKEKKKKRERR